MNLISCLLSLRGRSGSARSRTCSAFGLAIATAVGVTAMAGNASAHMGHMGGTVQMAQAARGGCFNPYLPYEEHMTRRQKIEQARRGGPHISADATIMARNKCGELVTLVRGSNGFVCIPNADPVPTPSPVCLDPVGFEWYTAAYFGTNPKPTGPGVGYMAMGGGHWEIDGQVFPPFPKPAGAILVPDPPHWMLLWEFDSKKNGLPSYPNTGDVTVVFDGSPFAVMLIAWDSLCSAQRGFVGCLDSLAERGLPK